MDTLFDSDQFSAYSGAPTTKIEYLVRAGILRPAVPASRRGVSRKYDLRNLFEAMVAIELINAGALAEDVRTAVSMATSDEYWPRIAKPATRRKVAMLVLYRLSGDADKPILAHLFPPEDVGVIANTGYTIIAGVSVAYVAGMIEKEFPGAWRS